jgi:SAM-dependent methyltransferase
MYEILAQYYDALAGDSEACRKWTQWVFSKKDGGTLLDCGCGTGEISSLLAERFAVTGIDLSEEMVNEAKKRKGMALFQVQDMRTFEGTYDVITCFCDSINYLSKDEVKAFIVRAADHLRPGGLFMFDMHAPERLEEFADGYVEAGTFADGTQVQWAIESEEEEIYQDFTFYLPDGSVLMEHHTQEVFDPNWIQAVMEAHFEDVERFEDFGETFESAEKIFFSGVKA